LFIFIWFTLNFALCFSGQAQIIFDQGVVKGGVTAAGFSTGLGFGSGQFQLQIEDGSTIQKAYLFTYRIGFAPSVDFILNDVSHSIDTTNLISSVSHTNPFATPINIYYKDISDYLDSNTQNFQVTIPNQFGLPINWGYWTLFLFVVYENLNMENSAYSIIINDKDFEGNEFYQLENLNPINSTLPVGFSTYSDRNGDGIQLSNQVYFNEFLLGIIGGSDNVNNSWNYAGVKGHFSYYNNSIFGLDDDVPNETMTGSDGLADVSNLVLEFSTSCNYAFKHTQFPNLPVGGPNINLATFLSYTTPCQPFETTLTEEVAICRGANAQLLATGGSTSSPTGYEWLPQEDLSCYDCPNPVFLGDSTRHYTVRIWSTDSCSKVLPVKVLVYDVPTQASLNLNPATCSESNGSMSISNVVGGTPQYIFNIGGNDSTNPNFNNLAPGVYNLQVTDANTCTYNQAFTIEEVNPVTAAFSANPQQGVAPLNVNFTNQSTGANLYQWLVNTQTFESFNLNYTFDTAGVYPVQLIAWYNEPYCADTTQKVIVVENAFSAIIPTLLAGSQGFWSIQTINVTHAKVQIYNAIGQLIHQTEQAVSNGPNALWNATGKATGYYFYRIQLTDVEGKEHDYKGKVLVVR